MTPTLSHIVYFLNIYSTLLLYKVIIIIMLILYIGECHKKLHPDLDISYVMPII